MKTTITQIIFLTIFLTNLYSQTRSIEAESSVVTNHFVTVNGIKVPYSATAGTLPVWSEDDTAVATLFYTYYKRTDVKDVKNRPIFRNLFKIHTLPPENGGTFGYFTL